MIRATDETLRDLERGVHAGTVPVVALVQARARRGLPLFTEPAWDPRRDPRPGDRVRGKPNNVLRLVVGPNEPVLAIGPTPLVKRPRYCVGKPYNPTRSRAILPWPAGPAGTVQPRITLPEVDPGTGEPPGYQLGNMCAHYGGLFTDDHSRVVHWRKLEGNGRRSGCCLLTSWRDWAAEGEVVW